jgi:hypothetical protein
MSRSPLAALTRIGAVTVALVATLAGTGASAAGPPAAQALPTPKAFVSMLDLECFRTQPYTPPTTTIVAQHLNPVLANLPTETHVLGPREHVCVPVAKNNQIPPAGVLEFVRFVDLSCYRIQGQTVSFPLTLRHLNPVLANQPVKNTAIGVPEHLCLPVIKNGVMPPPEVFDLVRYIDLKCYRVGNTNPLNIGLQLTQLNPVLGGVPPASVGVLNARQLCVPVRKNNQAIPTNVLSIVRWVDLERYDTTLHNLATPITLQLRHINPLLTTLPQETVTIQTGLHLMLPVAKNNAIPPG